MEMSDTGEMVDIVRGHARAIVGGRLRVVRFNRDGYDFLDRTAFVQYYEGKFEPGTGEPLGKALFQRLNRYPGITCDPSTEAREVNGRLNLWRGLCVKPAQGLWPLFEEHLQLIICGGHSEHYDYFRKWLAWMVQNPDKQAEVAVVLKGGRGVGKGVVGKALLTLYGERHGVHLSESSHLTGKFNAGLEYAVFLFADEAFFAGDRQGESSLKRLITEPYLRIEPKGVDAYTVPNRLHVLIASNEDWVIPAGADERRFCVLEVSDSRQGDAGYYDALHDEIYSQGGLAAFLYDMKEEPLGNWHPRHNVPQTEALCAQKVQTLRGADLLVAHILEEGRVPFPLPGHPDRCRSTKTDFHEGLWLYAKKLHPSLRHETAATLMPVLRKRWGCCKCSTGAVRYVQFPPLADLRHLYASRYGQQDWDMSEKWLD